MSKCSLMILCLVSCFIVVGNGYTEGIVSVSNVTELTLGQCLTMAQERSKELKIQTEQRVQAEQRLKQAKSSNLPLIGLKNSNFVRDTANNIYTGAGMDSRLTVSQPLFTGFKNKETIALSQVTVHSKELQYQNVARLLKTKVTQSFYTIVSAESDIKNIQNTLTFMQNRLEELKDRVRLGKSRESEVLAIESQIATLNAQLEKSKGDRAKEMETLACLLEIEPTIITLNDNTPIIEESGKLETFLETVKSRPDIESARQEVMIQSAKIKISKGAMLPTLKLDGTLYAARSGNTSIWDTAVSIDMPLFAGGILRSKIDEDVSRLRELEIQIALITCNANAEVRRLHTTLISSLNQVSALKDAYTKSEKSYQLQLKDYQLGLVNNLDVIQAMATMSDVKRNLDKAVIQVKNDKAMLDIAVMK